MALYRLRARLVIDLLGKLKAQSRTGATGFGALSEKELKILMDSASKLDPGQSEDVFTAELVAIRKKLDKMMQQPAPGAGGGATVAPVVGPKEGDVQPIPGYPDAEMTFKSGKWVRTK